MRGTSNVSLKIRDIATVQIPLPPLSEQRRIVGRLEHLASKIEEARGLREQSVKETASLSLSSKNALFDNDFKQKYPVMRLGDISEVRAGVTLGRRLEGKRTIKLPYLRVANVQDSYLDLSNVKEVEVLESEQGKWQLRKGDLLLTEGGDWDKLGRGTVWNEEIPHCIHQNHIYRIRIAEEQFIPRYLSMLISSPYGKEYFQAASKQTTNLATINQRQLKAFEVICPPLCEQQKIVEHSDVLQTKIDGLKQLQGQARGELDALLPSILDKAFRGEL